MVKRDLKSCILVIVVLLIFISLMIISSKQDEVSQKKYSDDYFMGFNFYLTGVVVDVKRLPTDSHFIVGVLVDSCSIDKIDPRDSLKSFFILKNENVAVIYDNGDIYGMYKYRLSDRIIIDNKSLTCYDSLRVKFNKDVHIVRKTLFPYDEIVDFYNELLNKYNK